jgi:sugar phosphate isomerase/epimerase
VEAELRRRGFLASIAAGVALRGAAEAGRLGIVCQLPGDEGKARAVLAAAAKAGFRRTQIAFPWDRVSADFLRGLPGWVAAEGLAAEVLSAYVNCAAPENVVMSTRAEDFDRALGYAGEIGARRVVAWTGGYGAGLMKPDPRNARPEAADAILRFLEPRLKRLEEQRLILALETYITLACPDAPSLSRLLKRLPATVTAVLDPPNLTPVARYAERDAALREMVRLLGGRTGVVHLKDFRLAGDGQSYELPGPLDGEMNYPLFLAETAKVPPGVPLLAEHIGPAEFARTRERLLRLMA